MEEAPKKLNAKAYVIIIKEKEALNQWLYKQLKAGLIVKSKSRYTILLYSKEGQIITIGIRLQENESIYNKRQDTTTLNWKSHW